MNSHINKVGIRSGFKAPLFGRSFATLRFMWLNCEGFLVSNRVERVNCSLRGEFKKFGWELGLVDILLSFSF